MRREVARPFVRSALAVLILAACSWPGACRDLDVVTHSYATLEEARREGAVDHGWIPTWLPPDAREIREAHDLDANRQWGLFNFPQSQRETLRQRLSSDEVSLSGMRIDIPGRVEWWPVLLRGALDEKQTRATGLRAYRATQGNLMFLVNWDQGRAYFWAVGS
jgi:hypothetical protein